MTSRTQKLIIFSGLPGVGKTTLAKRLANEMSAVFIRVDTIEQALKRSVLHIDVAEDAGYQAAFSMAQDNLQHGKNVLVDAVNPLNIIRNKWLEIAEQTNSEFTGIEITCLDKTEHQKRVEERKADIEGHILPSWQEIVDREYEAWNTKALKIHTANITAETAYKTLLNQLN